MKRMGKKSGGCKAHLWFWATFLVALALGFIFDPEISEWVISLRFNFLTQALLGLVFFSSSIVLFFLLTSLFMWNERKRRWMLPLWLSLGLTAGIILLIKLIVARARPFLAYPDIITAFAQKASYLTWDTSFPSSHAAVAFAALPILDKEFPRLKYFWLTFALVVAFSRIYFGVHYMSDVLVGAGIGYLIGFFVVKAEEKYGFGKKLAGMIIK